TPLRELVAQAGGVTEHVRAFLVGGYFGSWLGEREAADASLLEADLRPRGARAGARAIVVLPTSACGICETARAMRYLAASSAGQCGPCVYGLDAIARAFDAKASAGCYRYRPSARRASDEAPARQSDHLRGPRAP